ncbi:unnamed protein product [Adineta steineri]|uniref:Uncharacterized protein n=1 Tax=Adineta steineri TaxID=433720 RepID=A0A815DYL9_9BILA|nr:unnamed protein product [Adineta steineri]CAF3685137.1 unnamed protein product [Adineta steineri]
MHPLLNISCLALQLHDPSPGGTVFVVGGSVAVVDGGAVVVNPRQQHALLPVIHPFPSDHWFDKQNAPPPHSLQFPLQNGPVPITCADVYPILTQDD